MKILVVSQWFPPEPLAGPARFFETARVWVDRGHEVLVVAGIPNWPTGKVHASYRRKLALRESYQGVSVFRVPVVRTRNEGATRRLVNHGSFVFSASVAVLAQRFRPDVVVATSPPLFAPIAGVVAARRYHVPFVLDVRDLWPDSIWALSTRLQSPGVKRWLEWLERYLYRSAASVTAISRGMAETIRDRGARTVTTITNGVDLTTFSPSPPEPATRAILGGNPNDLVVLYAGTLGLAHGLETALDAAGRLSDAGVHFAFAGEGADRDRLVHLAAEKRLRNVTFVPLQERSRMPQLYAAADVCLVSLRRLPLFTSALPSKMFEIMGCGRPMVAAVQGEAAELISNSGAGRIAQPGSVDSMVDAIRQCKTADLAAMGVAGRRFAEQHFDRRALALRYEELLMETAAR